MAKESFAEKLGEELINARSNVWSHRIKILNGEWTHWKPGKCPDYIKNGELAYEERPYKFNTVDEDLRVNFAAVMVALLDIVQTGNGDLSGDGHAYCITIAKDALSDVDTNLKREYKTFI